MTPYDEMRVQEVADELIGTCNTLDSVATPQEMDSLAFLSALDDVVLCCNTCGWWCEASEIQVNDAGDNECEDCI